MKRYEGFKVPLLHLRSGQLVKKLAAAGSRIKVTTAQAKELQGVKELLEIVPDTEQPTVEAYDDLNSHLSELDGLDSSSKVEPRKRKMGRPSKEQQAIDEAEAAALRALAELLPPEEEPTPEELEDEEAKELAAKLKAEEEKQLLHKFVELTTLLPPLPQKGSFDVKSIRDSLYFFS